MRSIQEYAECLFRDDEEQKRTFESLTAAFVLQIYNKAKAGNQSDIPRSKKISLATEEKLLLKINRRGPLLCFLSGPGGTG